jgi:hypothetical protein
MSLIKNLFFETQWNIGWTSINAEHTSSLENLKKALSNVRFLKKGRLYFLADPFIADAEKKIIIAEYFHFFKGYGELVVLRFDEEGNISWMKKLPSKSDHYSYPYVLKDFGRILVFPESSMDGCQKCIELKEGTYDIFNQKMVISQVNIVDPTIFKFRQSYIMFANPADRFNDELWVYQSDKPCGSWKLSFKMEGKNMRGAGNFFIMDGKLYRPSQMNEKIYGGGIVLNEVLEIKDSIYFEKEVDRIQSSLINEKIEGVHTLNMEGSLLVTDIRYQEFLWWKPIYKIYLKLRQTFFR